MFLISSWYVMWTNNYVFYSLRYIIETTIFSLTAVRFGRVPKKEKARIIEQMQKNTMHSQTSQMMTMFQNSRDLIQAIVTAHHHTCVFTHGNVRQMREDAIKNNNFVNCPAQMVTTSIFLFYKESIIVTMVKM